MNAVIADPSPAAEHLRAKGCHRDERQYANPVSPMNRVEKTVIIDQGNQEHQHNADREKSDLLMVEPVKLRMQRRGLDLQHRDQRKQKNKTEKNPVKVAIRREAGHAFFQCNQPCESQPARFSRPHPGRQHSRPAGFDGVLGLPSIPGADLIPFQRLELSLATSIREKQQIYYVMGLRVTENLWQVSSIVMYKRNFALLTLLIAALTHPKLSAGQQPTPPAQAVANDAPESPQPAEQKTPSAAISVDNNSKTAASDGVISFAKTGQTARSE